MGKKVIPEQVEYFCDKCKTPLSSNNHDHFTVLHHSTGYDYSGHACGGATRGYELCASCNSEFEKWLIDDQA